MKFFFFFFFSNSLNFNQITRTGGVQEPLRKTEN